jgi:hypothetical protein
LKPHRSASRDVGKNAFYVNPTILDAAFADYVKQTGIDLAMHPFADQLQACHSPDDVLKLLEEKQTNSKTIEKEIAS